MTEVMLHIYDVTNSGSDNTNNTIVQINKIFKDGIGLGGIFHSAVQVYGEDEWSFGFCEQGTGVFSCPARKNPMYTYRECIVLGKTDLSKYKVNQILRELSREWPGNCYDLLSKNCNHFCNELCERLDVPKLPGWVNRFANAGDTAVEIAESTAIRLARWHIDFFLGSLQILRPQSLQIPLAMLTETARDSNNLLGLKTSWLLEPSHQLVSRLKMETMKLCTLRGHKDKNTKQHPYGHLRCRTFVTAFFVY
ncbi:deSI-like protein At4g17486 isoform X2 [Cynara cardunculus var. scolymus]|uniref:deSI-like protein At4g17486 isoform X2 n=1 Tax=Cynara cardunculus var. scolymus TaxID=59895 RepID=UPI000D62E986|nr:deSI-like protein At4g17486 isoform X2 [Cynara cardunculus var. scolymus]